jgi:hypothetical protein
MRRHQKASDESTTATVLDRRSLLRRAGSVAAIATGAAVMQTTGAGSASAAAGDPAVLGPGNDAGANTTAITSAATGDATLHLANTGTTHGTLSLADCPAGFSTLLTKTTGELYADAGDLYWVDGFDAAGAFVFTESTAHQVVGIKPVRMLDTRSLAGRTNIVPPVTGPSPLDSLGRVIGLRWLQVDLSSLADIFESAFVNLTAVSPTAPGYLTIAPSMTAGGGAPSTSNLNFGTANLANAAVVPSIDGTVWIYASRTTHVLLDVNALNLPGASHLLAGQTPAVAFRSNAQRRAAFAKSRSAAALRG